MLTPFYPPAAADPETSRARADALIAWLRDYAEARIDARLFDERRCIPPFIALDFGNHGLMGLQIPEEFGGLALRYRDFLRVIEQLGAIDISLASLIFIHNANGVRPIMGYAKPELRAGLLPVFAQGRELSAYGLTEPAAGSNLPALETRAEPDGEGGWILSGVKRWNASGWAGTMTIFARTADERGRLGHASAFVVRQGMKGLRYGPESLTMGVRSIMQNALILEGVRVGPENLLGEIGQGMEIADEALLVARLCMGAISIGAMKRCAKLMHRYASRRQVSTGRLIDSPMILDRMSAMITRITTVSALVDLMVETLDSGLYPAEEACMIVKIVASDMMWEAADDLMQVLGGRGYMENNPAAQILRDCRMLRVGEGANELMTLSVGRRALHSEPLRRLLRQELGGADLDEMMRRAADAAMARCLAPGAPFAGRGEAVAWAHTLAGRLATKVLTLAALDWAGRRAPSDALARARQVAAAEVDLARIAAEEGSEAERLMIRAADADGIVAAYDADIGDLEPAPPGIEEMIDPLLRRTPTPETPVFGGLPGSADGKAPKPAALSPEAKRQLAAALLKRKLNTAAE